MRPLALTKKQIIAVLGSAKLVDRMLWATQHADGWASSGKGVIFSLQPNQSSLLMRDWLAGNYLR